MSFTVSEKYIYLRFSSAVCVHFSAARAHEKFVKSLILDRSVKLFPKSMGEHKNIGLNPVSSEVFGQLAEQ